MSSASFVVPDALQPMLDRHLARLRQAVAAQPWPSSPGFQAALARALLASDFLLDTLCRQPSLLAHLAQPDPPPLALPQLDPAQPAAWPAQLRRYRAAASARLVWRDVLGLDDVEATLAGSTTLAEDCLALALQALEGEFAARHGVVRAADGGAQRLVVFGLGKLGGGELNFSSDVDLVYAYPQGGESDGARPLAAEEYFARLGQRLARLLDETTADGFSHRVDLRLRPFGSAGRVALSFAGMDHYFQREGRDWERYAWLKARAVAGDVAAGEAWLHTLRPFVYRRYLDFTALDGLREMKAAITAEVARHDRLDDIKRGPGGIREIEFLVQSLQLIRGGREPALRERRLLPALQALVAGGQVAAEDGAALVQAYRFLRRLENRLQMLRDAQTHALPEDPLDRARIALALGYADWAQLYAALQAQRDRVAAEFAELLAPRVQAQAPDALAGYWRGLPEHGDAQALAAAGFADAGGADQALRGFVQSLGVRTLSDAARARLDRVLPALLHAAARSPQADAALHRVLGLLQAILRRASYLALLDEQPSALARLVDVLARSAFLSERLVAYPVLLDELLDSRVAGPMPDRAAMRRLCDGAVAAAGDDPEAALRGLNEARQALSFRIALAALDRRQPAVDSARQLAELAEGVVLTVLRLARADLVAAHGEVPGGSFAIVGYGSLGGIELGIGSDLDLVFLRPSGRGGGLRWAAPAGERALVRAAGAEGDRPARRGHRRRAPVRHRRAPAPGRRQGRAGVVAGQLHRVPARARLDLGAPGAGARARRGRRCRPVAAFRTGAHADPGAPARRGAIARGRAEDARAHARRAGPQRRGALRPEAGRRRPGRPGIPAAGRGAARRRAACRADRAARHARPDRRAGGERMVRCADRRRVARGARDAGRCRLGLHAGSAPATDRHDARDRARARGDCRGGAGQGTGIRAGAQRTVARRARRRPAGSGPACPDLDDTPLRQTRAVPVIRG